MQSSLLLSYHHTLTIKFVCIFPNFAQLDEVLLFYIIILRLTHAWSSMKNNYFHSVKEESIVHQDPSLSFHLDMDKRLVPIWAIKKNKAL